jgi:WXG100 family type VII secretion target
MAEQVRVNYETLNEMESKFARLADDVQAVASKIKSLDNNLRQGGWVGRGSDAFYAEMDDLVMPAISRLRQALDEGGQTLNRIARIFGEAEEEAQSGFVNQESA